MAIKDDFFGPPYIDVDQWRENPVGHRYVHGGFKNSDTRFSFYFPPKNLYAGRFLHLLQGGLGGAETSALLWGDFIHLAFECGGYLVESNQGHISGNLARDADSSVVCWRASAEAARYAKQLAAELYGEAPHHGYVFGGSGGGLRSIACLEHDVDDVWDGGVPYIIPDVSVLFGFVPLILHAIRVLEPVLPRIADAVDVGGSGNPFDGLTVKQANALAQLYKAGFPRHASLLPAREAHVIQLAFMRYHCDPEYFNDFWTKPGYLGADDPQAIGDDLIEFETIVTGTVTGAELGRRPMAYKNDPASFGAAVLLAAQTTRAVADAPAGLTVADADSRGITSATVEVLTGVGAGSSFEVTAVLGEVLVGLTSDILGALNSIGAAANPITKIARGDRVRISNRNYLAFAERFRHQVEPTVPEWSQFTVDGRATSPQRRLPNFVFATPYTHELRGKKVIMIQNMMDRGAWPSTAIRYKEKLRLKVGSQLENQFRLYFVEHAEHLPATLLMMLGDPKANAEVIDYAGYVQQAIRDLIDWVEFGKEPLPGSSYTYTPDHEVALAPTADGRRGLQPVVIATANGEARAVISAGESVVLEVMAEAPPDAGRITRIEWDPYGDGSYPVSVPDVDGTLSAMRAHTTHVYDEPGTYFPAVRVTAHRDGDVAADLYSLHNLGRARVVVR